jgi:hypothetical protein
MFSQFIVTYLIAAANAGCEIGMIATNYTM